MALRKLRNLKMKKIQVLSRSLNYVTFLYPFHYKTQLQQWDLISDGIQLYHMQTDLSHLVSSSTGGLTLLARYVRSFRAFISRLRHKHTMLRLKKYMTCLHFVMQNISEKYLICSWRPLKNCLRWSSRH